MALTKVLREEHSWHIWEEQQLDLCSKAEAEGDEARDAARSSCGHVGPQKPL